MDGTLLAHCIMMSLCLFKGQTKEMEKKRGAAETDRAAEIREIVFLQIRRRKS